jgi:hypothetical protein
MVAIASGPGLRRETGRNLERHDSRAKPEYRSRPAVEGGWYNPLLLQMRTILLGVRISTDFRGA